MGGQSCLLLRYAALNLPQIYSIMCFGAMMTPLCRNKAGMKVEKLLVCLFVDFSYFCRKCQKTAVCTNECSSVKIILIIHKKKKKSKKVLKTKIFCRKHTNSYLFPLGNGFVWTAGVNVFSSETTDTQSSSRKPIIY